MIHRLLNQLTGGRGLGAGRCAGQQDEDEQDDAHGDLRSVGWEYPRTPRPWPASVAFSPFENYHDQDRAMEKDLKPTEVMKRADEALTIGVSSRALFDLGESHRVFETSGLEAFADYQVARENELLEPGVAFPLVRKLLALNDDNADHPRVEVILLSRNSADTGLRIFNTIEHFGLNIERAAFTNGASARRRKHAMSTAGIISRDWLSPIMAVRSRFPKWRAAASVLVP